MLQPVCVVANFWAAHVVAAEQEGISASEYARRHGLVVKSLQYWRRKLEDINSTDAPLQTGKFVALHIAPGAARQSNCAQTLSSGLRLEMTALSQHEWLLLGYQGYLMTDGIT